MTSKRSLAFACIGISILLGGCYQRCPSPQSYSLRVAESFLPEEETEFAGLERRSNDTGYTYGEVWAVPRAVTSGADKTTEFSGSNTPWTAVVYTRSTFLLNDDDSLQGKLTLSVARDGTVTALMPLAADGEHSTLDDGSGDASTNSHAKAGHASPAWYERLFARNVSCDSALALKQDADRNDLLHIRFMLARAPQALFQTPEAFAVFGVQVSANGETFSHSEMVGSANETFTGEFSDSTALAKMAQASNLRVFRISITAQRVDKHALQSSGNGRLIDANFNPQGNVLYVVNLGFVLQDDRGTTPSPRTGALLVSQPDR